MTELNIWIICVLPILSHHLFLTVSSLFFFGFEWRTGTVLRKCLLNRLYFWCIISVEKAIWLYSARPSLKFHFLPDFCLSNLWDKLADRSSFWSEFDRTEIGGFVGLYGWKFSRGTPKKHYEPFLWENIGLFVGCCFLPSLALRGHLRMGLVE